MAKRKFHVNWDVVWFLAFFFALTHSILETHTLQTALRQKTERAEYFEKAEFYWGCEDERTNKALREMTDYAHKLEKKLKECR